MALTWEAAREQAAAEAPIAGWSGGSLKDKYVVPPFSVLNTASGDWQDRRRFWLAMGIKSELGRGDGLTYNDPTMGGLYTPLADKRETAAKAAPGMTLGLDDLPDTSRRAADQRSNLTGAAGVPEWASSMGVENMAPGTSIFDPVLCELVYRWWAPDGGRILDPFAGGSVRGVVAGYMGHPYTGIDLSADQIASNREQADTILRRAGRILPQWIVGDSLLELPRLDYTADLLFTCPPYYDLEVYSDDPADISNMPWPRFLETYRRIIGEACDHLAPDRFAVIVVGEVRDKRNPNGSYVGLIPETIRAFTDAGLQYYNEVILVNAAGSLPVRAGRQFEATRKIGKQHQNVLVFLKGKVSRGWSVDRTPPPSPQMSAADFDAEASEGWGTPEPGESWTPQPIAAAAAAAGVCPCPMPDHATEHDHEFTATGAWGCVTHDHPNEIVVENAPSAATTSRTTRRRRPRTDDGSMYGPDGGPRPADPVSDRPGPSSDAMTDLVEVAELDADTEAIAAEAPPPRIVAALDPDDGWRRYDEGRAVSVVTGEVVEVTPEAEAVIAGPAARPTAVADPGRSRAAVTPIGSSIGAEVTDVDGWACTGCGSPPDGSLRTTVQAAIRRGHCPSCDRDKPFMQGL